MASSDHGSGHSTEISSYESGSTAVDRDEAILQDDTPEKHATIVDINIASQTPRSGLTFKRPSVDDLLLRGPSKVMREVGHHRTDLRWIHLRSNCMKWIEDLMDRICEERGVDISSANEDIPPESPISRKNPILRKDLYGHLFHGKEVDQMQSRFMGPTCTAFSLEATDEESDSTGNSRGSSTNLVMYMPYMHWESSAAWKQRQALLHAISSIEQVEPHADRDFVKDYAHHHTSPFHDRRSLEQAYYHDFGMTASLDDQEQVMERHIRISRNSNRACRAEEPKLIVIDQLWLWLIKGISTPSGTSTPDLIITAFPDRFNGGPDSANVYRGIIQHLERGLQPSLRKPEDLIACIVEHCTGVFFQRQLEHDKWFLEFFAAAIGSVRQRQKHAYAEFCDMCVELERLQSEKASLVEISKLLEDPSFAITKETGLFREVKDIVDELARIDYILARQETVVRALTRNCRGRSVKTTHDLVLERRDAWQQVAGTARTAYDEIQSQMDLKQKQSSLSETRSSRYQAEDSARHGRIMLLFTVVTIIFLPMSFMASWFGMNPKTPALGDLKLSSIAAIIFPISLCIAGVALGFAFSERLRDFVAEVFDIERLSMGILGNDDGSRRRSRRRRRQGRGSRMVGQGDLEMGGMTSGGGARR